MTVFLSIVAGLLTGITAAIYGWTVSGALLGLLGYIFGGMLGVMGAVLFALVLPPGDHPRRAEMRLATR